MMRVRSLSLAATALLLVIAGQAEAQGLGRFLPNRSGGIDGKRGAYIDQIDVSAISTRLGSDRALAFAGEAGNSGLHGLRLPMPETERSLAALVTRLDQSWGDRPRYRDPQLLIFASTDFEAQAKPDGSIRISLGLIEKAKTDNDLAFVLGHELSHIRLGHFADDESLRQKRQWVQDLGENYWSLVSLSQTRLRERGGEYQAYDSNEANTRQALQDSAIAYEGLQYLLDVVIGPAWSRDQEDEADALGYDFVHLAQLDAASGSNDAIRMKSSDYQVRVEAERAYRAQIERSRQLWSSRSTQADLEAGRVGEVAGTMITSWASAAIRGGQAALRGYLSQPHRAPEARLEMLSRYSAAVPGYSDIEHPIEGVTDELQRIRSTTEYQSAIDATHAITQANTLRSERKYAEAMTVLGPILQGPFKNTPVVNNTAARILGESGDVTRADRLYWIAHRSPDQYLLAFEDHARLMALNGRYADARRVVTEGGRNYLATLPPNVTAQPGDEEKSFLPTLITIAFGERQRELAGSYIQRCVSYEEAKLKQACAAAAFAPANFAGMSDEERYAAQAEIDGKMRAQALAPSLVPTLGGLFRRN